MRITAAALVGVMLAASCSSASPAREPSGFFVPGGLGAGGWTLLRNGQTWKAFALSETAVFVVADPGTYELLVSCNGYADPQSSIPVVVLPGKPKTVAVPPCPR